MKVVIIGGTGLIGSKVVTMVRERGHEAVAASLDTGVNTITGEGLAAALSGADVVVDVSNSPSFDGDVALKFFQTSTGNLLAAEAAEGVRHHVALSIVGVDRLAENGYFGAKVAQEELIRRASVPYSIVHATQFFEFLKRIADDSMVGGAVRLAPVMVQPMAAEDVAQAVTAVALGSPINGIIETTGPEPYRLDEVVRLALSALKDPRSVVTDPQARYYGAVLNDRSLMPGDDARIGKSTFQAWLQQAATRMPAAQPTAVAR